MNVDPVTRGLLIASTVMLAVILALNLWVAASGRGEILTDIDQRAGRIEQGLTTLTCIALIPDDERTDIRVAECSVNPEGEE